MFVVYNLYFGKPVSMCFNMFQFIIQLCIRNTRVNFLKTNLSWQWPYLYCHLNHREVLVIRIKHCLNCSEPFFLGGFGADFMGTMKCSPKFYCTGHFKVFLCVIQVFSYSVQETWLSCLFRDFLFPQKQLLRKMNYLLPF